MVKRAVGSLSRDGQRTPRSYAWPSMLAGNKLAYGGDYNPDQWSEEVWEDDIRLMKQAGVNMVALAIFSWDRMQPSEDTWDFDWLDRIINKLGEAGISVDLATGTAAAPLWLYAKHPEVLPVEQDGTVVNPGSRQSWRATSPIFRQYALELCRQLAVRYADNPYVVAWHANNEYGWNNRHDYSEDAQQAFREWCKQRYGTIDALNEAWGTTFWSQEVHSFDEVLVPRHMGGDDSMVNPSQQLDFERFGSDALKDFFIAERDVLAQYCPDKPVTTNFMISTDQCVMDYPDWSDEVDFVSNDHYFKEGAAHLEELMCSDSLVGTLAHRKPWFLMEHSTSAVQWKPVNTRKKAGELVRDALAHVAMGADGIGFFQWRQSRFGAEAFHSAMLPHAGEHTEIFKQVCELGQILSDLSDDLVGSDQVRTSCAILFDAESEWATRSRTLPTAQLNHWHDVLAWYRGLLAANVRADVVSSRENLDKYEVIIAPTVLLISEELRETLYRRVKEGATLIVNYATGLCDERFHVALGGYPGRLLDLAGVRGEEFNILGQIEGEPDEIRLSDGGSCRLWATVVTDVQEGSTVLATYEGESAEHWEMNGRPAIVQTPYGKGSTLYVGCDTTVEHIVQILRESHVIEKYVDPLLDAGVVSISREGEQGRCSFYFNLKQLPVEFDCPQGEVLVSHRAQNLDNSQRWRMDRYGLIVVRTK